MSHRNVNYLSWCIEEDLKVLSDWFKVNSLTLNEEKSVTMTFRPQKFTGSKKSYGSHLFAGANSKTSRNTNMTGSNITVNNVCLPDITYKKFLGVWIDSKLTWNHHLSKLYVKLKKT